MKTFISTLVLLISSTVNAQMASQNCWISKNYQYANEAPGIKTIKASEAIVAFNEGAVAFYSPQTGFVSFNYESVVNNELDTSINVVQWKGLSLSDKYHDYGTYMIKFQYGKCFEIQKTTGDFWYIKMNNIVNVDSSLRDVTAKYSKSKKAAN